MAGEERLLSLCAASVVVVILKRCQGKRNIVWAYYTLMVELRNFDVSSYRNFIRMDATSFEKLLQLVAPLIT